MKFVFVFLVCALQISAQEVLLEGTIYDNKTKKPIPYVALSILSTVQGVSTNEEGYFFIDVPSGFVEKKVLLSALGYKDTIVPFKKIVADRQFGMVAASFKKEELVIAKTFGDPEVLNPIAKADLKSGFSAATTPSILATYFPNTDAKKKYVNKVTVFLKKEESFIRPASKFRVRVFALDPKTNKPGRDLLHKSIVLEVLAENDFVSVDLSDFNIPMPTAGIFIGLEWLFVPYNWHVVKGKDPVTNESTVAEGFAPTFGAIIAKTPNSNIQRYQMGVWVDVHEKSIEKTQNRIPAVSLSLSKVK